MDEKEKQEQENEKDDLSEDLFLDPIFKEGLDGYIRFIT